ncbi:DUF2460 domain-containing protein [Cohaesibacter celericrescens]|uniref:TIGR02217 family protein n=1 Tax=Cohaesibacter celericrescens TaxID=2067669 RepID=A0A2N5XR24_9HYPH|nr:DUF2460 domain-containing protein [Cohaesibacter celericrescens]PLW76954.1 TIGR02217 family protein [Cohaesibacter celericrescens]
MNGFHEILFPLDVGFGASGGPERRTDVATLASGFEERNARWASSRRTFDAGLGVRSFADLQAVLSFFEERRGKLYGFRFRDPLDHASCGFGKSPSANDQTIAIGDGTSCSFVLIKTYGGLHAPYYRTISKPVAGSVAIALNGADVTAYSVNEVTGTVTFDTAPADGAVISAGFLFDVPVRFDTDKLEFSLSAFEAGDIPSIPLVEIRV